MSAVKSGISRSLFPVGPAEVFVVSRRLEIFCLQGPFLMLIYPEEKPFGGDCQGADFVVFCSAFSIKHDHFT